MGFEPACLIGNQSIGSTVGFVKTVTGKLFHQIKNIRCQVLGKTFLHRTLGKQFSLLSHFLSIFLTHGSAQ